MKSLFTTVITTVGIAISSCGSDDEASSSPSEEGTCQPELAKCQAEKKFDESELITCNNEGDSCQSEFEECTTKGQECQSDLSTCQNNQTICSTDLGVCDSNLSTCQGENDICQTNLDERTGQRDDFQSGLSICDSNLAECTTQQDSCQSTLGVCQTDLTEHDAQLDICETGLAGCSGQNTACQSDLGRCNSDLITCDSQGAACQSDLAICAEDLTERNSQLNSCQSDLTTCNTQKNTCQSDLETCNTQRNTCQSDLTTCSNQRVTCQSDLAICAAELQDYQDNLYRDTGIVSNQNLFSRPCSSTNSDSILPDGNLSIFQDSKFGGHSQVWWSVNRSCPSSTGCCLELHYNFSERQTTTYTPYAGLYAFFSYLPYGPIDVSGYSGVRIEIRSQPIVGSTPQVAFQLADIGPNTRWEETYSNCRDGFFQAGVLGFGASSDTFHIIDLNFSAFARPFWYGCFRATPLQTSKIMKFALLLLNASSQNNLAGIIQIADLHFQ